MAADDVDLMMPLFNLGMAVGSLALAERQQNHAEKLIKQSLQNIELGVPMAAIANTLQELEYGLDAMRETLAKLREYTEACQSELKALEQQGKNQR